MTPDDLNNKVSAILFAAFAGDKSLGRMSGTSAQSSAGAPFDKANPRLNYVPSDLDRTHVIQSNWFYALPFVQKKRFANQVNRTLDAIRCVPIPCSK